jgi:hypothetical protein
MARRAALVCGGLAAGIHSGWIGKTAGDLIGPRATRWRAPVAEGVKSSPSARSGSPLHLGPVHNQGAPRGLPGGAVPTRDLVGTNRPRGAPARLVRPPTRLGSGRLRRGST